MKKVFTTIILMIFSISIFAQNTASQQSEMEDLMRSNGKIYVVIAVMLTILSGLILYLVKLDRKINKLEKNTSL